jgi:hypothetical protein
VTSAAPIAVAVDDISESGDGTHLALRPNCRIPGEPSARPRFTLQVLGSLVMVMRDRLRAVPTARVLAAGQPFIYPLEVSYYVRESLADGPASLAPDLPADVAAAARARRAVILVFLAYEAMPLNLDASGRRWMFDVVQEMVVAHDLPPSQVWFVSGNVWGGRLFGDWLRMRRLYEPEVFRFRAVAMVPSSMQASYRTNAGGAELRIHQADDIWSYDLVPLSADAFAARYVTPADLADERRSGRVRPKRFLSFNRTLRLHRQVVVSYLAGRGLLDDSLVSFGAGAVPFFDLDNFPIAGEVVRRGWEQVRARQPLVADAFQRGADWHAIQDGTPYRQSYFNIVTETEVSDQCAPFSTEKILKPMLNLQPFLLVATAETLRYVRAMGFKTFDRLVDEGYDRVSDPIERLGRIFAQIDRLAALTPAEARDRYFDCLPEFEHNRAHLIDGTHDFDVLLTEIAREFA